MGRTALVPKELRDGPFTLADALRAGLDRWHLEGASWRRIGPTLYVWAGLPDTPELKIEAVRRRLPPTAVFSGLTAAWLHGLDVEAGGSIEVTIPKGTGVSGRSGIVVRRAALTPGEVVNVRALRVTSLLRTISDLSVRLSVTEGVVIVDMALHAGLASMADLKTLCVARARGVGVAKLRRVVGYAEPAAESPMESRLRMLLVLDGLPRPQAQVSLHDKNGRFVGRPDLYYPDHQLGIEYDGGTHRASLAEDNRRQNKLIGAGFRLLRFTAAEVLHHPDSVTTQVRAMLGGRRIFPAGAGIRGYPSDFKPAGAGTRGKFAPP